VAIERTRFDERRAKDLRAKLKTEQRPWRQRKLLKLLNELDDPVVTDALIWTLANKKDEMVRALAADGLALHRSEESRLALLAAAKADSTELVRRHATESLVNYVLSAAEIETITATLLAGDKSERLAAVELLAAQSDPAAIPPLLALLEDSKFLVRFAAFVAIRDRSDPELLPILHRAAEREGPGMRRVLHGTAEEPAENSGKDRVTDA